MMFTAYRFSTAIGALAIAMLAPPALAAAAKDATAPADAAAAPADAASEATQGLGEIVVTATKRETNLQKTPIAISVLSTAALNDRHVTGLIDLADGSIPSLRVATFEARQSALTIGIRGIVPFDQNQTARDGGVGVYIDGVYLGRTQGLNATLLDVQRVEVLKGPQGTLFGRNTEGGALSIVTAQPTGQWGGRVSGGVGNYGSYSSEAHLNLPETYGFSIKLDGMILHQDATVADPLAGQTGWNYHNTVGGRISSKWQPFDGFTATFAYDKIHDENTPNYSQLINYNPKNLNVGAYNGTALSYGGAPCNSGPNKNVNPCIAPLAPILAGSFPTGGNRLSVSPIAVPQQPSVDVSEGFSANLKYVAAPWVELRSITAWRRVTTDQWDNSGGAARTIFAPNANFSRYSLSHLHQRQFSQELQAVGSIPHLDYVFGLYYFSEYAREYAATPSSNKWNADGTGYTINSENAIGPISSGNQGWDPASWFRQRDSFAFAHSYAAFAQATWSPVDTLHLTLGGRYTKDTRRGALTMVSGVATPYTFTFNNNRFDPMVTLAWDAAEGINLYAKYSTGYRAGGANDRSSNFQPFGPESVKAYEVGAKMDLLDRKVRLNLAGFIMDRKGTQIDFDNVDTAPFLADGKTPNPNFNLHTENTANAPGLSKIRGFEAELTARPVNNLTLGAAYTYMYTNVPLTANPNPGPTFGVLTQIFVVYTPKNALSGYADYEYPVSSNGMALKLHIDANYADAVYSFQTENLLTDPSFSMNGRLSLADIPLGGSGAKGTVGIWVRNLTDNAYIYRMDNANQNTLGYYGNFNPPRTFGIDATVKF